MLLVSSLRSDPTMAAQKATSTPINAIVTPNSRLLVAWALAPLCVAGSKCSFGSFPADMTSFRLASRPPLPHSPVKHLTPLSPTHRNSEPANQEEGCAYIAPSVPISQGVA